MDISRQSISFDNIINNSLKEKNISLSIARLDKIHEDVSGNKIFKLHYFIEECFRSSHKTLITFGGAFSNHLVATAFLCSQKGIKSFGIVRGEEPQILSHTLERCKDLGMSLKFISRQNYKNFDSDDEDIDALKNSFGDFTMVPEGGYHAAGAKGASFIMDVVRPNKFSHICTAVGTATTLAGLLLKKKMDQEIIAIPVIKNMIDIPERLNYLGVAADKIPIVFGDYHFGGYAKHTKELISFINSFYAETQIPTDFVYTAKMMYAVYDKINSGYFADGSNILCIHTGGLQGNKSLPQGTIIF